MPASAPPAPPSDAQTAPPNPAPAQTPDPRLDDPLLAEHYQAIELAKQRRRPIDRAIKVSAFNGWSTVIFACFMLVFAIFSWTALAMGLAMAVVAFQEFRGKRMLRQLDVRGPRLLACNQIVFALVLTVYCVKRIYTTLTQPSTISEYIARVPELADIFGPLESVEQTIMVGVYACVILLSFVFQGATAVYYYSRQRHLHFYLSQTPQWIVDLQGKM